MKIQSNKKRRQTILLTKRGLFLKINRKYQLVDFNQIIRLTAASNYTTFYFNHTHSIYISSKTLLIYTKQLPDELFLRVHRSHLVNRQFITFIGNSANRFLTLKNKEIIPVARRKYSKVRQKLATLQGI